ncbi:MAG: hypothetical protein GXO02_00340 [Epsilonproteobacteria bacterium]|nr:hypothetical protein [Campylobacterota bacterium]
MKVKQYNIKVFEIEIDNKFEIIQFIQKNITILQKYLINLKGEVDEEIEDLLRHYNILYTKNLTIDEKKGSKEQISTTNQLEVMDMVIRSGCEIVAEGSLVFLKRINSGAFIHCERNFIALDIVEGMVVCNGDFMLIKASNKAKIIFNGYDITEQINDYITYKVKLRDDEIEIKEYKGN